MSDQQMVCEIKVSDRLKAALGDGWYEFLGKEFVKPYMKKLMHDLAAKRSAGVVYPSKGDVFNAYKLTPYNEVKVCIVGQDPYINEFEAHGLAFSTYNGQSTPSLRQIEKAIKRDLKIPLDAKWSNDLTCWARQGVFLLNRVLTVEKGKSNSHKGLGWETFTEETIKVLDRKPGMIFLLWGKDAQTVERFITKGIVIKCEHPVAASYQGRMWNNDDCFNRVNNLLIDKINW